MAAESKPPISFIGLGAMGFGMATHLVKQGYSVRGFDAYAPTLDRFAASGGEISTSLGTCVADRPVCICMVATAKQAQAALLDGPESALSALPHSAVLLLCSTVPAGYVRGLENELSQRGRSDIRLVDCPVSGGAIRAADGTLSIMAGGGAEAMAAGKPILQEMAADGKLYEVKGGIGAGSNMKMCHQVLAACQILGASEAMGFAVRLGIQPAAAVKAILEGEAWTWMFENRSPRMLHPQFQPLASALAIIAKDTAIITSEARKIQFPITMVSAAEQAYLIGIDRGWMGDDDSGMVRLYLPYTASDIASVAGTSTDLEKLALVTKLMKATNTLAATEALALARAVKIDISQLHNLSVAAAGGSWVLSHGVALEMLDQLNSPPSQKKVTSPVPLRELVYDLRQALDAAAEIKCPLPLGSAAYGVASSVYSKTNSKSCVDLLQNYIALAPS